ERDLNAPLTLAPTEPGDHTEGSVFFTGTATTLIRYGGVTVPTDDRLYDIPQRDPGIDLAMVHAGGTTLLRTVPLPEPRVTPTRSARTPDRRHRPRHHGKLGGTPVRRGRDSCGRCVHE